MPIAARVTTRALPPAEMNGSGRPVIGSRPDHTADVDHGLGDQPGGDAGGGEPAERVVDPPRDPEAGVREHREQGQDHDAADHAQLLGDHREDEVVVRLGQPVPLQRALAQPDAEPAALVDRRAALQQLVAGAQVAVLRRVQERGSRASR